MRQQADIKLTPASEPEEVNWTGFSQRGFTLCKNLLIAILIVGGGCVGAYYIIYGLTIMKDTLSKCDEENTTKTIISIVIGIVITVINIVATGISFPI